MRGVWLLALLPVLACSNGAVDSGAKWLPIDSSSGPGAGRATVAGRNELIPAEWTVFEDTTQAGEVITASLQLPAARDIQGLLRDEAPRLILRCVDGKVEASIDTGLGDEVESAADSSGVLNQAVKIELDSAPACE